MPNSINSFPLIYCNHDDEKILLAPSSQRRLLFTFDFEVVSSKAVGLEVEGQRRVGLIQEQVDAGQVDAVPLEHGAEHLAADTQAKPPAVKKVPRRRRLCGSSVRPSPQGFLFHGRDDLRVDVHVEVELEAETLLAGVLRGGKSAAGEFTQVGAAAGDQEHMLSERHHHVASQLRALLSILLHKATLLAK